MMEIGALKHRLSLEAPAEMPDGAGGVTRSYTSITTLWAAVAPVAARGEVQADALAANVTHRILIRARSDVTTRHRLRDGSRIFRILALRETDSGRFIEIQADERVE